MNFEDIMAGVDSHHRGEMFIETLRTRFIPALANKLAQQGHVLEIHVEQLGISVNVILARGNQWVAEFAIILDNDGPYWIPVLRQ